MSIASTKRAFQADPNPQTARRYMSAVDRSGKRSTRLYAEAWVVYGEPTVRFGSLLWPRIVGPIIDDMIDDESCPRRLRGLVKSLPKEVLRAWLRWNDPNGDYLDEENWQLTKASAVTMVVDILEDNEPS